VPQGWILDLVDIEDPVEQYEAMSRVAQTAERLGFRLRLALRPLPHLLQAGARNHVRMLDRPTAALARDTSRIRLGQMVTCNGYRNPALLAKMASTVDVLSHGRLDFGIGAGWYEHEYRAYGYEYPPTRRAAADAGRGAPGDPRRCGPSRTRRSMASSTRSMARSTSPRASRSRTRRSGSAVRGEKVTLRLAARYGDATNFGGHLDDMSWYAHKWT
jgi:hypothetical protein